jgi:4-hydroxythreonine-4-phosphate dehydrogenase
MGRPLLLLTPGMGVGPEVCARGLQALGAQEGAFGGFRLALIGREEAVRPAFAAAGVPLRRVEALDAAGEGLPLLDPGDDAEPCEVQAIRLAARACLSGDADALVTGPIHKARLAARGFRHMGHTDLLGALCGVDEPVMAFTGGDLRVALVTVHLALSAVPALVRAPRIERVIAVAAQALRQDLGIAEPRLLVCGLNPHAGEQGLLGREEIEHIAPAVRAACAAGIDARGPVSAESAFLAARRGEADLVVAMYHDQGLAPLKAVDFGRSVNWTLGLPIVRTSVDHGTADELVGTGSADPASFAAALRLAADIARRRREAFSGRR